MKTLNQIQTTIYQLEATGRAAKNEKEKNRCRKELKLARKALMYLEYSPTEESITRQLDTALKRISIIQEEFEYRYPSYCDAKTKSDFMKGNGLPEIKKQVELLKYIL